MLDEREGEVARTSLPRAFNRQSCAQRFAIVLAGPLANFLLAIFVYWLLFMHGVPGLKPVVGAVAPATAAAHGGNSSPANVIVAVGGEAGRDVAGGALGVAASTRSTRSACAIEVGTMRGEIHFRELDLSGLRPADLDSDFLRDARACAAATAAGAGDRTVLSRAEPPNAQASCRAIEIARDRRRRGNELGAGRRGGAPRTRARARSRDTARRARAQTFRVTPDAVDRERSARIGRIGVGPKVDPTACSVMVEVRYGAVESIGKALEEDVGHVGVQPARCSAK